MGQTSVSEPAPPPSLESLQALLTATSAALLASLQLIDAERSTGDAIRSQVAQLRAQVHGKCDPTAGAPLETSGIEVHDDEEAAGPPAAAGDYDSVRGKDVTVVRPLGIVPITLVHANGTRSPASLIAGTKFIEVVESCGRVRGEEFVGISEFPFPRGGKEAAGISAGPAMAPAAAAVAMKQPQRKKSGGSSGGGGGGFMCCFMPTAAGEEEEGGRPAASFSGALVPAPAGPGAGPGPGPGSSSWRISWGPGREAEQHLVFMAGSKTHASLLKLTALWLSSQQRLQAVVPPQLLLLGAGDMQLQGEGSQLLGQAHWRALAAALPPLERMRPWKLSYSTARHGTALSTLYRRCAAAQTPTLLLLRDSSGYVFGGYTPDGWRVAPRFYGTGETFVFQLEPHRLMFPWHSTHPQKNDFFQYATPDSLALGGLGKYALHLEGDLLRGSSGACGTFGSSCLAGQGDFKVSLLEVWQAV